MKPILSIDQEHQRIKIIAFKEDMDITEANSLLTDLINILYDFYKLFPESKAKSYSNNVKINLTPETIREISSNEENENG